MRRTVRSRISSAHVLALAALFVALGGTAVAQLGRDSIGPLQIRPGAVGTSEIRNGAVGRADLGFSPVLSGALATAFAYRSDPIASPAEPGRFATVVERRIRTSARTSQTVFGQVTVTRVAPGRGTLTVRGEENDEPERYTARVSLDQGETATLPLSFVCDPMAAGVNRYIIGASGPGFEIRERSLVITANPVSGQVG